MKIAVVTGASSGLGREFVRQLALLDKQLDEIWVIARRRDRLEALRAHCRVPLRVLPLDLTAPGAADCAESRCPRGIHPDQRRRLWPDG